ncbi:MAG: GHKL domain-containing protein [Lachnospiraceae bacterium]|nr:GHKL domain-containing protein [Lachnospiraceae bacterium]
MNIFVTIGFLIANVFYLLAIERFMGVFFEKRKTSFKVMALSYLLYFVLASAERLLLFTDFSFSHLTVIPVLFVISLNYGAPMIKKLVAVACNYVLFTMLVAIPYGLISIFYESLLDNLQIASVIIYSCGSLLSYLTASLLRRLKYIRKNQLALPKLWGSILFVQILTLIGYFSNNPENVIMGNNLLITTIFLTTNLFILYLYDSISGMYEEKLNSALQSQEKDYYLSQSLLMQESVERMKAFKHDIRSHLTALKEYFLKSNPADATMYFDRLLGEIEVSEVYSETGNIAFDSIINYKLRNARQDNIQLDVSLFIPQVISIEVTDVVTILANLLDNALDAIAKVDEKILNLYIEFNKDSLFIRADNSFDGFVKYSEGKIGEEKQITTSKNGAGHGYGLKNIKKAAEKYNGCVDISHTNKIFSVKIFLYINQRG